MDLNNREALAKKSLNEQAKQTLRKKQRGVTPRIAILYLDCDKRQQKIQTRKE